MQGSDADILKLTLVRLWEDRQAHPTAVVVLTVHDEIVVECAVGEADVVAAWPRGHMEAAAGAVMPDVPSVVDVTIAAHWAGGT